MKRTRSASADRWLLGAGAVLCLAVAAWAMTPRPAEVVLGAFVTSLHGRTPNQVHNVRLATQSINDRWLLPGQTFSFNRTVGSWSSDTGYKRAPVSYDGELVPSWGGGVCQASTTLYNAALLAGLTPIERHRHQWLPRYVAPGRDAAVAYSDIDLRFRNDHPYPVRIEGEVRGEVVLYRIVGTRRSRSGWSVDQDVSEPDDPAVVRQPWRSGLGSRSVRNPGKRGCRVRTWRTRAEGGRTVARELLSDDTYPAMNRLLLTDAR